MAQNSFVPVSFTGEQYPSADVPVWTMASVAVPMPNDDKQYQSSSEFPAPSAPEIGDLPPNYFDISVVPNGSVLHYNEVVPYTEPSKAEIERKNDGVLSFDPLVDKNPDQLWLYFMTYLNEKPSVAVNVHGYHVEVLYHFKFIKKIHVNVLFIALCNT